MCYQTDCVNRADCCTVLVYVCRKDKKSKKHEHKGGEGDGGKKKKKSKGGDSQPTA